MEKTRLHLTWLLNVSHDWESVFSGKKCRSVACLDHWRMVLGD